MRPPSNVEYHSDPRRWSRVHGDLVVGNGLDLRPDTRVARGVEVLAAQARFQSSALEHNLGPRREEPLGLFEEEYLVEQADEEATRIGAVHRHGPLLARSNSPHIIRDGDEAAHRRGKGIRDRGSP